MLYVYHVLQHGIKGAIRSYIRHNNEFDEVFCCKGGHQSVFPDFLDGAFSSYDNACPVSRVEKLQEGPEAYKPRCTCDLSCVSLLEVISIPRG